jgi:hypothetical protein
MASHLAQLNIGRLLVGFVDGLDRINQLADQSPGFVWRLQSDSGNATFCFGQLFPAPAVSEASV